MLSIQLQYHIRPIHKGKSKNGSGRTTQLRTSSALKVNDGGGGDTNDEDDERQIT